jgi:hypothetical protein
MLGQVLPRLDKLFQVRPVRTGCQFRISYCRLGQVRHV